jgi:hypothetical protein
MGSLSPAILGNQAIQRTLAAWLSGSFPSHAHFCPRRFGRNHSGSIHKIHQSTPASDKAFNTARVQRVKTGTKNGGCDRHCNVTPCSFSTVSSDCPAVWSASRRRGAGSEIASLQPVACRNPKCFILQSYSQHVQRQPCRQTRPMQTFAARLHCACVCSRLVHPSEHHRGACRRHSPDLHIRAPRASPPRAKLSSPSTLVTTPSAQPHSRPPSYVVRVGKHNLRTLAGCPLLPAAKHRSLRCASTTNNNHEAELSHLPNLPRPIYTNSVIDAAS